MGVVFFLVGFSIYMTCMVDYSSSSLGNRLNVKIEPKGYHVLLTGQQTVIHVNYQNVTFSKDPMELSLKAHPRQQGIVRLMGNEVRLIDKTHVFRVASFRNGRTTTNHSETVHSNKLIHGNDRNDENALPVTAALQAKAPDEKQQEGLLKLMALKPGRTELEVVVTGNSNNSSVNPGVETYVITVVDKVDLLEDVFNYVLYTVQTMTLFMLGFRMRKQAMKEVLLNPCGLIAALMCQTMLVPLITLGAALALALEPHYTVCLLVVGCCPTAIISPMFAVLQHAHVELAILLLVLETAVSFGVIPLWLYTYGQFLGLDHGHISLPYFHVGGMLVAVTAPLLIGVALQRCSPRALGHLDKAIHPTCLMLTFTASTVSAYSIWRIWDLATYRLLSATVMVPALGCLVGALSTAMFRKKLSEIKSVALVTGLQNTLLASIILQISYPVADASLMHVVIICMEFTTLCFMYLAYIVHVTLWICGPVYRSMHENPGISGIYGAIAQKIVKSMIKAGEISFKMRSNSSSPETKSSSTSTTSTSTTSAGITLISQSPTPLDFGSPTLIQKVETAEAAMQAASQGFSTLGIRNKIFSNAFDSARRNSFPPPPPPPPPPPLSEDEGQPSCGQGVDLALTYFGVKTEESPQPESIPCSRRSSSLSDKDALSIDYEIMLNANKKVGQIREPQGDTVSGYGTVESHGLAEADAHSDTISDIATANEMEDDQDDLLTNFHLEADIHNTFM